MRCDRGGVRSGATEQDAGNELKERVVGNATEVAVHGVIIGEIRKNARERIVVRFDNYNDHDYLDIRVFAETKDGLKPTRAGVTVRPSALADFRQLIELAEREFSTRSAHEVVHDIDDGLDAQPR